MTVVVTILIALTLFICLPLWCPQCAAEILVWLERKGREIEAKLREDDDETRP